MSTLMDENMKYWYTVTLVHIDMYMRQLVEINAPKLTYSNIAYISR